MLRKGPFIELRDEPNAFNDRTDAAIGRAVGLEPEVALMVHYDEIRRTLEKLDRPALVLAAVDDQGLAACATLPARWGEPASVTLGRHSEADIVLQGTRATSLRHLQVVVHPFASGGIRWRVIDLRTGDGMRDESGARITGFEGTGCTAFYVSGYTLLAFARGDQPLRLYSDPRTAWARLPLRSVVVDPRAPRITKLRGSARAPDTVTERTDAVPEPTYPGELRGGDVIGTISVREGSRTFQVVVDDASAHAGVLLGRYPRCDCAGLLAGQGMVSRVHSLIVRIGQHLYALDAGSSNGLWVDRRKVDSVRLTPGARFRLAANGPEVEWRRH